MDTVDVVAVDVVAVDVDALDGRGRRGCGRGRRGRRRGRRRPGRRRRGRVREEGVEAMRGGFIRIDLGATLSNVLAPSSIGERHVHHPTQPWPLPRIDLLPPFFFPL